jgi:hypothetical protein
MAHFHAILTPQQKEFISTFLPNYQELRRMRFVGPPPNKKTIQLRSLVTEIKDGLSQRLGVDWNTVPLGHLGLGGTLQERDREIKEVIRLIVRSETSV